MANTVQAADILEVTLLAKFFNEDVQNKFHYACISVSGAAQSTPAVAAALQTNFVAPAGLINLIRLMSPNDYSLQGVRYQVIAPVRQVAYPIVTALAGLNGFDTTTANVAFAITKRGDLAGRKNISTTHLMGTTDSGIMEEGKISPQALTLAENIASFLSNQVSVTVGGVDYEFGPVIYHPTDPSNPTPITSTIVQRTVRVMRRRTVGLGS